MAALERSVGLVLGYDNVIGRWDIEQGTRNGFIAAGLGAEAIEAYIAGGGHRGRSPFEIVRDTAFEVLGCELEEGKLIWATDRFNTAKKASLRDQTPGTADGFNGFWLDSTGLWREGKLGMSVVSAGHGGVIVPHLMRLGQGVPHVSAYGDIAAPVDSNEFAKMSLRPLEDGSGNLPREILVVDAQPSRGERRVRDLRAAVGSDTRFTHLPLPLGEEFAGFEIVRDRIVELGKHAAWAAKQSVEGDNGQS